MVNCFVCDNRRLANRMIDGGNAEENVIIRRRELARLHRIGFRQEEADVEDDSRFCFNCYNRILRAIEDENNPNAIPLNVLVSRANMCFFCNQPCRNRLSFQNRIDFYCKTEIYCPVDINYCIRHLTEEGKVQLAHMENRNCIRRGVVMSGNDVSQWFQALREAQQLAARQIYDSEDNLTDVEMKGLTSLNKEEFRILFGFCDPVEVYRSQRVVTKKDLMAFLIKLRQGLSDNFIASLMKYSSRPAVSTAITTVRKSLMLRFVPRNIGLQSDHARDRNLFINTHVTEFANHLYNPNPQDPKAILYPDCTYLKAPKSSHFRCARQSYSMHKKYTLLKAGLVVAPDGFILDVHGPYFSDGRNNDASILIHDMHQDRENLRHWVQDRDIFVVDRGYRDALGFLDDLNLNHWMPPLLVRGQRQFTTEQANLARIVTKTRWIVESRNGHLKSIFKFFRDMIPMYHCFNLGDFVRIACALINRFHPPIHMQGYDADVAERMLVLARQPNLLQERVERERLDLPVGRHNWIEMHQDHLPGFPRLPLQYIRDKTFGTYQVQLAPAYIQDRLGRERRNEFTFQTQLFERGLLRVRLYSRMTNAAHHTLYISFAENYPPDNYENRPQEEPILGTYCTCKAGARTLGVCAHVASVLWYLGYARHEEGIHYPSDLLLGTTLDAARRNDEQPQLLDEDDFEDDN